MGHMKFTKDHKSGFKAGQVVVATKETLSAWKEAGYAEEATKKEFDAYNKKAAKDLADKSAKARADHKEKMDAIKSAHTVQDANEENKEEDEAGNVSGADSNGAEKLYHTLTEEDLESDLELFEGFSVGQEVEINDQDELLTDEEGKLIAKK